MKLRNVANKTILVVFLIFCVIGIIFVNIAQGRKSYVSEEVKAYNASEDYYKQVSIYNRLKEEEKKDVFLNFATPSLKATYENATYNMKTDFKNRFIYLISILDEEKEKLVEINKQLDEANAQKASYEAIGDVESSQALSQTISDLESKKQSLQESISIRSKEISSDIDVNTAFNEKEKSVLKLELERINV